MDLEYSNFTECYLDLVERTYNDNAYVSSPRGQSIRENLGVKFRILNPRDRIPYVAGRGFSLSYMVAELLWYLSANNETAWIANYSNFWNDISDDGITANSAYGARLLKTNPRIAGGRLNQWEWVKDQLTTDPDSRRGVLHIRVPDDSLDAKLDMPCTLALQFFIRENKLELVVHMRSSDVIFGIAYDIPAFTLLQELMALQLGVGVGSYTHISNSLHIYERHFKVAERILTPSNINLSLNTHSEHGEMMPLPVRWGLNSGLSYDISRLFDFERDIRNSESPHVVNSFIDRYFYEDLPFIHDWASILAIHRLKKIQNNTDCTHLKTALKFSGYQFFRR